MDYRDPNWVADRLGLEKNTVYRLLQDGQLPAVQLGRKWLISQSELEGWLKQETKRQTEARRSATQSQERVIRRLDSFSPNARAILKAAHTEARRFNHSQLGQEHLLLGFAQVPDSIASRALRNMGVKFDDLRNTVEQLVAPGNAPAPRRLGRTPQLKQAMRVAATEAKDPRVVRSEDLLLGLLSTGGASRMLAEREVDEINTLVQRFKKFTKRKSHYTR